MGGYNQNCMSRPTKSSEEREMDAPTSSGYPVLRVGQTFVSMIQKKLWSVCITASPIFVRDD